MSEWTKARPLGPDLDELWYAVNSGSEGARSNALRPKLNSSSVMVTCPVHGPSMVVLSSVVGNLITLVMLKIVKIPLKV